MNGSEHVPSLSISYPCPGNTSVCVYLSRNLSSRHLCIPGLQMHISHISQRRAYPHSRCISPTSRNAGHITPSVCICLPRMHLAAVGTYFTYQRVSQFSTNSTCETLEEKRSRLYVDCLYPHSGCTCTVQVCSACPPPKLGPDAKIS